MSQRSTSSACSCHWPGVLAAACRCRRYWDAVHGRWICGTCHPLGHTDRVRAWHIVQAPKGHGAPPPAPYAPQGPSRPWSALTAGERRIIQAARDRDLALFDKMLLARFTEGLVTADAEIAVVLDLLDRELGIDRG